jgi:hypothetical protein
MAVKSNFSADEWKSVLESPLLAGFAISAADPSGFISAIKEGWASTKELATARTGASDELIKAVAEDLFTADGRTAVRDGIRGMVQGLQPAQFKDKALGELKRIGGIVDAKAPADAAAFKSWLAHIAQLVAEASAEGGFLGLGGNPVSDKEKATLAEIHTTLGV